MTDVTRIFSSFLAASRYEDIPEAVRHEAKRAILNCLGCALGACRHETVDNALAAVAPFSGPAQAGIWGRTERVDIMHAALLNGISSHVLDFDDTHAKAVHPSAPVLPAALAIAEWKQLSGADLVHAFVLGVEAEVRIALSVFPEHYERGWHITGTAGVFGAAAAASKLLGLDAHQTTHALGVAATQSSGLIGMFGSMSKSLHPGRAAQSGITAALLASQGFTSSEQAIEAPRGFGHVASTKFDPAPILTGLGERYELSLNMYKPYACGLWLHATIDGCVQLRNAHGLKPKDISRIDVRAGHLILVLTGQETPKTGLEGKFSVFHTTAVAIIDGKAGEAQYSDARVNDPDVVALRSRVHVVAEKGIGRLESHVRITMNDGTVHELHVPHALGSVERPMRDRDLEEKFSDLAAEVLTPAEARRVMDLCWNITGLGDAGELARACAVARR